MTDTLHRTDTPPASSHASPVRASSEPSARRLRAVLAANASTSFACGVAGLVAAPYWADTLGIDSTAWIRVVSVGLVLFAIDVALVAARSARTLSTATLVISIGDLAWVAATAIALTTVSFTTTGWILAVVIGVGVLDFALLQLWFRRRLAQ
ncbi:hypothetical protein [Actinospongicola halichondriae]|uniref:hypothetical protein n=1 Tax=Actinospongicola halichondriae TaxID=3236844 RepID=UPI003D512F3D